MVRSGSVAGRCASCPGRRTNGALDLAGRLTEGRTKPLVQSLWACFFSLTDVTATRTLSFPLEGQWRDFTHRLYPYKDLGFSW